MQDVLDERIKKEKGLEGQDLLPEKILALQVELGELANEWRGFKFWSENQRPNIEQWVECAICDGTGDLNYEAVQEEAEGSGGHEYVDCDKCGSSGTSHMTNPLLEEYVDCLHFILSIGLSMRMDEDSVSGCFKYEDVTVQFCELYLTLSHTYRLYKNLGSIGKVEENYQKVLYEFTGLGEMLGFTWEQIEQAYYDKNQVNHKRQENGY